jgi:hypothetical protein
VSFDAHVLKVLIASPGDTNDEREAVERALHGWNADRAEREQVVLLPRRWETSAVPRLGSSGQSVINEQLVDRADIVHSRSAGTFHANRQSYCTGCSHVQHPVSLSDPLVTPAVGFLGPCGVAVAGSSGSCSGRNTGWNEDVDGQVQEPHDQ